MSHAMAAGWNCGFNTDTGYPNCIPKTLILTEEKDWVKAYDAMYEKMAREYVFTDYKRVDFQALYEKFLPAVKTAYLNHDLEAYLQALRGFAYAIPDGHVIVFDGNSASMARMVQDRFHSNYKKLGYSYGLALVKLSNGKFIAGEVDPKSAAYKAGLRAGDEVVEWNGLAIQDAVNDVSNLYRITDWVTEATENFREIQQVRRLTRAPTQQAKGITITFVSKGQQHQATLSAYDDKLAMLIKTSLYPSDSSKKDAALVWKILPGTDIGYIRIPNESEPDDKPLVTKAYQSFVRAISYFNLHQVKGLILDIRGNMGGADDLAAEYVRAFIQKDYFYEIISALNTESNNILPVSITRLNVTPNPAAKGLGMIFPALSKPHFNGPVLALVNAGTISSGEGIALGIKKLVNKSGKKTGFVASLIGQGTHGSFGVTETMIAMPGSIGIDYTIGRSLDEKGRIQVDSTVDEEGKLVGGVKADIQFELTAVDAVAMLRDGKDVGLEKSVNWLSERLH